MSCKRLLGGSRKHPARSVNELKEKLQEIWNWFTLEFWHNLVKTMPQGIVDFITNKWDVTQWEVENPSLLADPVVTKIAEKHNKATSHVLLRYLTQNDIVVIPKSVKPERVKENFNLFDFTLDAEDLKALEALDKDVEGRLFRMDILNPKIKDHPEYPYKS